MRVLLYSGLQKAIEKSGVGRALYHQRQALHENNVEFVSSSKENFDIVHINTVFPSSLALSRRCKKKRIPVVYHAHSTKEDFRHSYIGSDLFAGLFKMWIKRCYASGDEIITPTEYSKKLLIQYGIKKDIHVISNGIDTEFYKKDEQQRAVFRKKYDFSNYDRVIMSVGLWIERKGILDFVDLARKMPEYHFIWFGEAPLWMLPRRVQKAVKTELPNLHFAGYVNKESLRQAYNGCDLFLFMSQEETEGIVVLEALSMEIPALIRDIPVYEEWLQDGHDIYKAGTQEGFEDKIRKIMENKTPNLTKEGRKIATGKDVKKIGKQLIEVYIDANFKYSSAPSTISNRHAEQRK